jgi:hypothetical protein
MPKVKKPGNPKSKKSKATKPQTKAKVYKLPETIRKKTFTKKQMAHETVNSLKEKARDHNAKVKGLLHIKLSQRKMELYRDVKFKRDAPVEEPPDSRPAGKNRCSKNVYMRDAIPYDNMSPAEKRKFGPYLIQMKDAVDALYKRDYFEGRYKIVQSKKKKIPKKSAAGTGAGREVIDLT